MVTVRMLPDVLRVHHTVADRWYVTTGARAVGPVGLELLARGIEAGRVPLESFVRHEGWKVWRPLNEIAVVEEQAGRFDLDEDTVDEALADSAPPTLPYGLKPADELAGATDRGVSGMEYLAPLPPPVPPPRRSSSTAS